MKVLPLVFVLYSFFSLSQIQNAVIVSTKCTYVNSLASTTNYGSSGGVVAGRALSGSYFTRRTYVEVDLASIPSNAIIVSANLKLTTETISFNPPNIVVDRPASGWLENSVTWGNQPSLIPDHLTTSTSGSIRSVNVKDHVQKMVAGVYTNNGWVLLHDSELESASKFVTFFSDDYSVVASRPKLEVSYYIPMSVTDAIVTHESTSGNNGSVSPTLVNGPGGTYTYQWWNKLGSMTGKTSLNLSGVGYGWYGLEVKSSVAGTDPFYYAFLVGKSCEEVPIEFNPGPNFIDDAPLGSSSSDPNVSQTNYGLDLATVASYANFSGVVTRKTLTKFRLWIDESLNAVESVLQLSGNGNLGGTSQLKRVSSDWQEMIVTQNITPSTSTDILVPVPVMTSSTEVKQINIIDFFTFWKNNNTQNYGFLFELQPHNASLLAQVYHSSDVTNISQRPKIDFKLSVFNGECLSYAEMKRKLDGGYAYAMGGKLKFTTDEEYDLENSKYLPFRIFDKEHILLESSDIDGVVLNNSVSPLPLHFDDNRWILDVSSIPGLSAGEYYLLEVSNSKGDKRYLRFFYKN